jgi:hypothetical protein
MFPFWFLATCPGARKKSSNTFPAFIIVSRAWPD